MKIAHVCPFYTPTICGIKQVVEELAKRQIAEGHEVHIYTSDWNKKSIIPVKEELIEGVYVHRCKTLFRAANFASVWPSVFYKLIKTDFDVIHTHLFGHAHFLFAALAARLKNIKHIHTTHCPWSDAHRSKTGKILMHLSYNIFSKLALRFTDKIVAITPWEINFIKKYEKNPKKLSIIPNGMSDLFFKRIKNNDFKKKNKINDKLVLFFARLNQTKAPDKFVETAKLILADRKDVTFVIRGPDEGMRETIEKMLKNQPKILLLGETRDRQEIIKMYQAADVYVLPSYREGLPLTLFEAMASGLPIVATPVNGVPYEMKEPENGFLVPYGDIQGFKKRILEILDNEKLKDTISRNNIRKSKNYDWDKISTKIMELYRN